MAVAARHPPRPLAVTAAVVPRPAMRTQSSSPTKRAERKGTAIEQENPPFHAVQLAHIRKVASLVE